MKILTSENNISFNGRVYYANQTARQYAPQYREIIHKLKHYTANKELSHKIYLNKMQDETFYMSILTGYKHLGKVDGFDKHELEYAYLGKDFNLAKIYFLDKIKEINSWKKGIDLFKTTETNKIMDSKKNSFLDKIKTIFRL